MGEMTAGGADRASEHAAHRYFKRAHGTGLLFGTPSAHAARIAAAVIGG